MSNPPFHSHPSIATPHGFFTAQGGVSEGIYTSLNCGPGSDDNPDAVAENRRRVAQAMSFDAPQLCTLSQTHSATCLTIDAPIDRNNVPEADAMATNQPNLLLGILTADCGPVLFADEQAGVIGAAHAGWKGAVGGVLENTLQAMESLGANRSNITAILGPCIHQASYEVSEEFLTPFLKQDQGNEQFFTRHCEEKTKRMTKQSPASWNNSSETTPAAQDPRLRGDDNIRHFFNLPAYIRHCLQQSGLQRIEHIAIDTYPEENHCFSNRRRTHKSEPDYGRQISVIGMK